MNGYYDLHIHNAPDVCERKITDGELAQRIVKAGFSGFAIKNHYSETASRAKLLKLAYPDTEIVGGIVLNRSNGGLNPYAVENCAKLGGRFVWMPTMDARSYNKMKGNDEKIEQYISIVDDMGQLLPEVHSIIDVVAANNMILATGHVSAYEGLKLVKAAKNAHVDRIVITHADSINDFYTVEEQGEAVKLGAVIEHCFFSVYKKQTTVEAVIRCMRAVGVGNTYISTDFGQVSSPYPDDGILMFIEMLKQNGVSENEIDIIARQVPHELISL